MSLVIAYKKEGVVYVGADTQTTSGNDEKVTVLANGSTKLIRLPNGILLGAVGHVYTKQHIWANAEEWFTLPEDGVLTKKHVVTHVVPQMFAYFRENDLFGNEDKRTPPDSGSHLLVAHKDKLFDITNDFSVSVIESFAAIGAGEGFVQYGMEHIDPEAPIPKQLLALLRIGASCNSTISAPFLLGDTATKKFKIVRN